MLRKSHALFVLLLLAAVAALYGQFLWNPIVFDDLPFFMVNDIGHQPIDDYHYSLFELRSLPYASLAWGKAMFGLDMLHFRIENLLLHAAVAIALFFFLSRLYATVMRQRAAKHLTAGGLAFAAALLFALHPVAVYAAGYLLQRTILMATLFSLLAMLAWLRGDEQESKPWLWASVLFYYLAVFSKEHAIMLPAMLLALTILLHTDWRSKLRQRWMPILGFVLVGLWVIAAKKGVLGTAYEVYAPDMLVESGSDLNYPLSVLTQSWLFFKYAALWLFPNPNWMSVDMREPFASSLWSGYLAAFAAFLTWGVLAGWLLFKRGSMGLLGFAMLFPWMMFLPEFSTIRIQESFVLYRSYLWAVGACALLPLLLDLLDKRMAAIVVGAIALAMFPISMDRLASFSHPLILWDDAARLVKDNTDRPGVYRIYYNLGSELIKVDEYDAAIEALELSVKLHPDWPFSYNNLGSAYAQKGKWPEAATAFGKAISIAETQKLGINPRPYFGRAMSYEQMGRHDLARRDYELTCRLANKGCDKLDN
ncbi:MAG: tetratricopeptide repeat protein [Gammaproteobacteria bacterium]|nr:tetratricopeptide repeat protein [Gammaproteobacteria bacterium]